MSIEEQAITLYEKVAIGELTPNQARKGFMKLIAEVIGEDEKDFTRKRNDGSWTTTTIENELRAEQRKRAGLYDTKKR